MTYREYLSSPHWGDMKAQLKSKRCKCDICGDTRLLHVHHSKYNLHNENIKDLNILCADCHKKIHDKFELTSLPPAWIVAKYGDRVFKEKASKLIDTYFQKKSRKKYEPHKKSKGSMFNSPSISNKCPICSSYAREVRGNKYCNNCCRYI